MGPDPSRARARARARTRTAGLTLLELMIVVAILGILAAVATPIYMRYLYRSKAGEAMTILGEIAMREESWRALPAKTYCNVSDDVNDWFPSDNPGGSQQAWSDTARWRLLFGTFYPRGHRATYFSYAVVAGAPGTPGPSGIAGNDHWYVARALGDLDDDGDNIIFEFTSESRQIFTSNNQGWE